MNGSPFDTERLASLLDGRLDQGRRAELLAEMASGSDDALEACADAIAIVAELETAGSHGSFPTQAPVSFGKRQRQMAFRWLAIAAALAGVALAPWLLTRGGSAGREDPGRFVSTLTASGDRLPSQWQGTPWPGIRGAGQPLAVTARAARLGARLVDLELAVTTADTTAAELAAEIAALVEGLPAAGPVATLYRQVGQRAGAGAERQELEPLLLRARIAVARLAPADAFQLAAWAEAGRIASAQRNRAFFRTRESRALLQRGSTLSDLPAAARAIVERLDSQLRPPTPPVWSALDADLSELLRVLGT